MSEPKPYLEELEQDALTELVNIGVSRAAASLRKMIGHQVLLAFRPDVNGEAAEASLAKWLPLLLRTDETVAKATPGRQR